MNPTLMILIAATTFWSGIPLVVLTTHADELSDSLEAETVLARDLNKALGAPLFHDTLGLWGQEASAVAKRLGMPKQSETRRQSSFRAYPRSEARFAGARPFSIALYGERGKVVRLSLVYANKGDFFSATGGGIEHFDKKDIKRDDLRAFGKAIDADEESIVETLTSLLNRPRTQSFGEGNTRQIVKRWDWKGHAFLLAKKDDEYVTLQIEPTASADEGGKVARSSDSSVRDRIRENVEKRPNGDVVIGDLPMVDQGPKGYCVPATFERCLRHVDVPADMYLLAMVGDSGMGGGTTFNNMVNAIQRDVRRKGRSVKTFSGKVKISSLARYIDDGVPVIWGMHSNPRFNAIANTRTAERRSIQDWNAWAKRIKKEQRNARDLGKDQINEHVTMIIGYNKDTKEIAISDSWGNAYRERWVGENEADEVSQGNFAVILP